MTLTEEQIAEIRARAEAASPGPWAYESVSEKSNDYCIGIVCPVDKDGDPGDPIMGNVRHHPHYFNAETGDFGEWYYEMVCSIDECEHGGDGSLHADARFIAHARDDIPALLSALEAAEAQLAEARKALEPLWMLADAVFRDGMNSGKPDDAGVWGFDNATLTYGHLRTARRIREQGGENG